MDNTIEETLPMYALDDAQHATVLAALRFYQAKGQGDPYNRSLDIHEIAINGGEVVSSLDADDIDNLCQELNCGGETSVNADLLAACEALDWAYKQGEESESMEWSDVDDAWALAKAAISKAKGGGDGA